MVQERVTYVEYRIQSGPVTRIQDFNYQADSGVIVNELPYPSPVFRMMVADSAHTRLRREMPMDVDVLEKERERVTKHSGQTDIIIFKRLSPILC
ncbi:MAG: hypothetical protein V8S95_11780 [Odoribacter sp.]